MKREGKQTQGKQIDREGEGERKTNRKKIRETDRQRQRSTQGQK